MASGDEGTRIEFGLLGPVSARAVGEELPLGGPRQRALLALLLLSANEVVGRDRLVDGLWGEDAPATAANALQVAVHGLRRALGADRIATRGTGYVLRVEAGELDLARFERLVARARGEEPAAAAASLVEALELWRGPALADVPTRLLPGRRRPASKSSGWTLSSGTRRRSSPSAGGLSSSAGSRS